jgi:hypothetical protein
MDMAGTASSASFPRFQWLFPNTRLSIALAKREFTGPVPIFPRSMISGLISAESSLKSLTEGQLLLKFT